jgi:hypothetical protein
VAAASWLNGNYSVYGRVVSGMNYVDSIVNAPRDTIDNPLNKIVMFVSYSGSNDSVPNAPVLNIPASGSYSATTSRVLKWFTQADGIIYNIEVATDSLFNNIIKNAEVGANTYTAAGLSPLTKYYWRVKTNNGGHLSDYSDVWNFYVSAVGIDENKAYSGNIKVAPNPSKGIFVFDNIEKGNQIEIVDLQGKIIFNALSQGKSTVVNISDQPRGVYFYSVISLNGIISNGKIILE